MDLLNLKSLFGRCLWRPEEIWTRNFNVNIFKSNFFRHEFEIFWNFKRNSISAGAFKLYDVDNDGFITRTEMYNIVDAIYQMVVRPIFFLIKNKKLGWFCCCCCCSSGQQKGFQCVLHRLLLLLSFDGGDKNKFFFFLFWMVDQRKSFFISSWLNWCPTRHTMEHGRPAVCLLLLLGPDIPESDVL